LTKNIIHHPMGSWSH